MDKENGKEYHIGLVKGRHEMKQNDGTLITEFVFEEITDVHDYKALQERAEDALRHIRYIDTLYLYITGLGPAVISAINAMDLLSGRGKNDHFAEVYIMHYDRDAEQYNQQVFYPLLHD